MTQNSINNTASDFTVDNLFISGNTIASTDTDGDIVLAPDGTGVISVTAAPIVPSGDFDHSLGTVPNSWDNVYANGLTFDGGTNIMAAYSINTFTPVLSFGGGTTGITYTTQLGKFAILGKIAFFKIKIVLSSKGTDVGDAEVATTAAITSANATPIAVNFLTGTNVSISGGRTQFFTNYLQNSINNDLSTEALPSTPSIASLTDANFVNTSEVNLSGLVFI